MQPPSASAPQTVNPNDTRRNNFGGNCIQPLSMTSLSACQTGLRCLTHGAVSTKALAPQPSVERKGIGMIFARWRARRASRAVIQQILGEIVAAARRPALYQALEAPDRLDGRFELLTLHAGLVLRRLKALGGLADAMAQ